MRLITWTLVTLSACASTGGPDYRCVQGTCADGFGTAAFQNGDSVTGHWPPSPGIFPNPLYPEGRASFQIKAWKIDGEKDKAWWRRYKIDPYPASDGCIQSGDQYVEIGYREFTVERDGYFEKSCQSGPQAGYRLQAWFSSNAYDGPYLLNDPSAPAKSGLFFAVAGEARTGPGITKSGAYIFAGTLDPKPLTESSFCKIVFSKAPDRVHRQNTSGYLTRPDVGSRTGFSQEYSFSESTYNTPQVFATMECAGAKEVTTIAGSNVAAIASGEHSALLIKAGNSRLFFITDLRTLRAVFESGDLKSARFSKIKDYETHVSLYVLKL